LPYQASGQYQKSSGPTRPYATKLIPKTVDDYVSITDSKDMISNPLGEAINGVKQGTADNQRTGKYIKLKSLRLRGSIQHNYSAADTTGNIVSNIARVIVVMSKLPDNSAAGPSLHTIFGNKDSTGHTWNTILDDLKPNLSSRYRVLRDMVFACNPTSFNHEFGEDDDVINNYPFDEFIDLMNIKQQYRGPEDTDIELNKILVYAVALHNDADNFCKLTTFHSRLVFTDA